MRLLSMHCRNTVNVAPNSSIDHCASGAVSVATVLLLLWSRWVVVVLRGGDTVEGRAVCRSSGRSSSCNARCTSASKRYLRSRSCCSRSSTVRCWSRCPLLSSITCRSKACTWSANWYKRLSNSWLYLLSSATLNRCCSNLVLWDCNMDNFFNFNFVLCSSHAGIMRCICW